MSDLIWLSDAQMHRVERLTVRRIHTRYDRCAHIFKSAICIAAAIFFWLCQRVLSLAI
jgi:hypothetical protein